MSAFSTMTKLEACRQQFPALANKAYFNYGGQGTLPQRAIAAIQNAHIYTQQVGPFSNEINVWVTQEMNQTREAIAAELNVSPATITLTENVSIGCNIAIWSVDWREGDHLLLSDCEHPSVLATAEVVRQRFGVKISYFPLMATLNEGDPVAVIVQHLRPTTRLVVLSHILWNTGQVLPLADIVAACHKHPTQSAPIWVLADAAQSVGMLPLHLAETAVDFYAFTGHKWLCGPAGIGGLYVRPEVLERANPTFVGWRGITRNSTGQPTGLVSDGRRFEVATCDFTLFGALREAIALHREWGTALERYQRIQQLSHYLWSQLSELPHISCLCTAPPEAGLVCFQVKEQHPSIHADVVKSLERQGFLLRTILHPDCIRACVHYFTTKEEIDQLVEAIQGMG